MLQRFQAVSTEQPSELNHALQRDQGLVVTTISPEPIQLVCRVNGCAHMWMFAAYCDKDDGRQPDDTTRRINEKAVRDIKTHMSERHPTASLPVFVPDSRKRARTSTLQDSDILAVHELGRLAAAPISVTKTPVKLVVPTPAPVVKAPVKPAVVPTLTPAALAPKTQIKPAVVPTPAPTAPTPKSTVKPAAQIKVAVSVSAPAPLSRVQALARLMLHMQNLPIATQAGANHTPAPAPAPAPTTTTTTTTTTRLFLGVSSDKPIAVPDQVGTFFVWATPVHLTSQLEIAQSFAEQDQHGLVLEVHGGGGSGTTGNPPGNPLVPEYILSPGTFFVITKSDCTDGIRHVVARAATAAAAVTIATTASGMPPLVDRNFTITNIKALPTAKPLMVDDDDAALFSAKQTTTTETTVGEAAMSDEEEEEEEEDDREKASVVNPSASPTRLVWIQDDASGASSSAREDRVFTRARDSLLIKAPLECVRIEGTRAAVRWIMKASEAERTSAVFVRVSQNPLAGIEFFRMVDYMGYARQPAFIFAPTISRTAVTHAVYATDENALIMHLLKGGRLA